MKPQIVIALALLVLLAGCATTSEPDPKLVAPKPSDPAPAVTVESDRPLLTGPAAKAEVQKILRQSIDWLDAGEAEQARVGLEYARQLESGNRQVGCLLRGITVDPVAALGKESTAYTVRAGENLVQIARRAMGEMCEAYLLARYNQIPVPKQLATGQTIRIPGKIVLAPPDVVPVAKLEPAAEPVKTPATPVVEFDPKARRVMLDKHHRTAQTAYRNQDLTTAIREWDAVLAIDPNNGLAHTRRQESLNLQRQLEKLGR